MPKNSTVLSQPGVPQQAMLQPPVIAYQLAIPQQLTIPQLLPIPQQLTFTPAEPIDNAFIKLSAYVTALIQNTNFPSLQRACIEKASSPRMLRKSNEIVPIIKGAESFQALCIMIAETTFWNFLDIRMMEAMAIASMIPAAQIAIENFKKTFFNMTLKEAAPQFPVIAIKPGYTAMHEDLDRDPSQMTIGELHKHRFYLEKEIVQAGPDTCTICRIMIGLVKIVWQIHVDHVYQTYSRLKTLHAQLSLQAIHLISIPATEDWEELPLLWRGQDIDKIGPIVSSNYAGCEIYPLPQGFEWCALNSNNFEEIIQLSKYVNPFNPMAKNFLKWFISSPLYKKNCLSGIRLSSNKRLVMILLCTPYKVRVGKKLLSVVNLQQVVHFCPDIESQLHRLCNGLVKETLRKLASKNVFQALMCMNRYVIPKPVITYEIYFWNFHLQPLSYRAPRTVGLRRMKVSDIHEAFTFTNNYTAQFEIGKVFQSKEEFSHWFLNSLVATWVVEEPNTGSVTGMFSFKTIDIDTEKVAEVIGMVITSSIAEQLITDLLVCTKQQNATVVVLPRFGLKKQLFKNFLKQPGIPGLDIKHQGCFLFYDYKYPEVDDDNHCLFGSRTHYVTTII